MIHNYALNCTVPLKIQNSLMFNKFQSVTCTNASTEFFSSVLIPCALLVFTNHPGCKNTILTLSNMEKASRVVLEIICALTEGNSKTAPVTKDDSEIAAQRCS